MRQTPNELLRTVGIQLREWTHVIRNAGWLVAERILRLVIGLGVSVAVARHLGPAGMGEFGLALGWAALLAPLATLCLDDLVIRELVAQTQRKGEVLGTALVLRTCTGLACTTLAPFAMWLLYRDVRRSELVGVVTLTALWGAADVFTLWFHYKTQMKSVVRLRSFIFLLMALVRLLLVRLDASLMWFAVLVAVETGLCALVAWALFLADGERPLRFAVSRDLVLMFLRQGWPLMLSGLAVATYLRVDQVLLPLWAGDHQAGLYAVALRISEAWYVIPTALTQSVMPRILASAGQSSEALVHELAPVFRLLTGGAYLVALVLWPLSPFLIRTLFGGAYAGAEAVLVVHVWAGVFVALGTARSIWDTGAAQTHLSLVSVAAGALVNLGLNAALIPRYGAVGAAIATLTAYAFATFAVHAFVPQGRAVAKAMLKSLLLVK